MRMEQSMRGSRKFVRRGGGPGPTARKQPGIFFDFNCVVLSLFYSGVQWFYYRENYNFPGGGGPTFHRGSNFFDNNTTHSVLDFKQIEESFIS